VSLYEICYSKAKEYLCSTDEKAFEIFSKIQIGHDQIFNEYFQLASTAPAEGESGDLKSKLAQNEKETAEVIAAANTLNQQFESEVNEKQEMKDTYEKEIATLKKQLKAAEAENKKVLDTLIRVSKGQDPNSIQKEEQYTPGSAAAIFKGTQNRKFNKLSGPVGKTQTRTLTLKQLKDIIKDVYEQKVKYD